MNAHTTVGSALLLVALAGGLPSSPAGALSLADVLADVEKSYEVRVARSAVEAAAKGLASILYPGSVELSADPGVKATTAAGAPFPQQLDVSGAVSLRVPVGLAEATREKAEAARLSLAVAEADLEAARSRVYVELYRLYQEAWLARAAVEVLDVELTSAQVTARDAERRYEAGEISLAELKKAEDELWKSQDGLLAGSLEQRLSWLSLLYASGRDKQPVDSLDAALPVESTLPAVTELVDWSQVHLPSVIAQRARVEAAALSLRNARELPVELDARIAASFGPHSASVSFATDTPQLTAAYVFPIATIGSAGGGSTPSTWSLGLSAGLTVEIGRETALATEARQAELAREKGRLESLLRSSELAIRSRYQQWLRAKDGVEQAQRSLERALEGEKVVLAKLDLGQASEADRLLSRGAVERARWNLSRAVVSLEEARLAVAEAAGYLGEMVDLGK